MKEPPLYFPGRSTAGGTFPWLNLDAVIANAGEVGGATLVEISLANGLTAYAENGAVAFIEKNDIDGLAIKVIPEPGTAVLMALGLVGLAVARPRPMAG